MSKTPYFSDETENAIVEYLQSTDEVRRNQLFNKYIIKSFNKLVEYHLYKSNAYKIVSSVVDFHHDVLTFLCEKLHKFDITKGRAYSYFNVITRNYVWSETKKIYQGIKSSDELEIIDDNRDVYNEQIYAEYIEEQREFINCFIKYMDEHVDKIFTDKKELIVVDSIIELFRIRNNIENFNKKALYVLIRERTQMKTQLLTKTMHSFKYIYDAAYKSYLEHDMIHYTPQQLQNILKRRKSKIKIKKLERLDN